MEITHFLNNPFSNTLSGLTGAITSDMMKRDGFKLGQNNYDLLSNIEKYISSVRKIESELSNVFAQIDAVKIFIRRFPSRKYYEENHINRLDYIRYHTEVFSHKVSTILDIMKLMVNEVYLLKIPKRNCSWEKLIKSLGSKKRIVNTN